MIATLTRSGKGIIYPPKNREIPTVREAVLLLKRYGFILIKDCRKEKETLKSWFADFGNLADDFKKRFDNETSQIEFPLHHAGFPDDENIRYLVMGNGNAAINSGAELLVSDAEYAWWGLPGEVRDIIIQNGLEVKEIINLGTPDEGVKWRAVAGYKMFLKRPYFFGSLNTKRTSKFHVSIKNLSPQESERIFKILEETFTRKDFVYLHHWEKYDVLIIDNIRMMHGFQSMIHRQDLFQMFVHVKS